MNYRERIERRFLMASRRLEYAWDTVPCAATRIGWTETAEFWNRAWGDALQQEATRERRMRCRRGNYDLRDRSEP